MFERVIDALVHGSGYERIASAACSDQTIRCRVNEWAHLGLGERLHAAALAACDLIIGLGLSDLSVDGCMTKAPCGGDKAGPSPVDRRKGGLKRSTGTDGYGIPLAIASAGAHRHDSPLLAPTLTVVFTQVEGALPDDTTAHLDAAYDSTVTRQLLDTLWSGRNSAVPTPWPSPRYYPAAPRTPGLWTLPDDDSHGQVRRLSVTSPATCV